MKRAVIAIAFGIASIIASNVSAASIDYLGVGKSSAVAIHSPVLGNITIAAGEYNWAWQSGEPVEYGSNPNFYAYCVDVNHYIQDPQTVTVNLNGTNSLNQQTGVTDGGKKAAWLFNTYAPTIHATGTNTEAAALQVAIWAALYNPTNTLFSGNFYLTGGTTAISTQAQTYLNALYSGPGGYYTSIATWLDSGTGQDQMMGNPPAVPEPASLLLFGTGLAGLGRVIRRRPKATRA